jgi:hypothetical protein
MRSHFAGQCRTIAGDVRSLLSTVAVLGAALALGGCGGGGGGGGGDGGGGGGDAGDEKGAAYEAAFDICGPGLKATAEAYAVEPTKEAVAQIVVEQVSGGSIQDEKSAKQGCLDALAAAGN